MTIRVGTIVKWLDPHFSDEKCEDGQCIGKVTEITNTSPYDITVKWWEMCPKHTEIDPNGTGPYQTEYLWEIGQIN